MSMIVRASPQRREAVAREAARRDAARREDPLSARTVRVRNVCLQHAAAHLHLPVPTDAQLDVLPGNMTLAQSVEWWRAAQGRMEPETSEPVAQRTTPGLARAVGIVAVVVLALAVTYGSAQ